MRWAAAENVHTLYSPPQYPQGAFSHSARAAPILASFNPGTPLQTIPLQKRA